MAVRKLLTLNSHDPQLIHSSEFLRVTLEKSIPIRRYSKPSADILKIKESFFKENDELVAQSQRWAAMYGAQPRRTSCKNCDYALGAALFTKLGIDYILCTRCNHLNGAHEDSVEFTRYIYTSDDSDYAKFYSSADKETYLARVKSIYQPKADFLKDCLEAAGEIPVELSYLDIGAGSGYFLYSLIKGCGLEKATGYEVSPQQVELGNQRLGGDHLRLQDVNDTAGIIRRSNANVVSMIGVLEHLRDPRDILGEIRRNPSVKYLYLSLPLFSHSVYFEILNQHLYNRQLSVAHTHLYTLKSIAWFAREFDLDIVGEWFFGTDTVDLYRFMLVQFQKMNATEALQHHFSEHFVPVIDSLQAVMDRTEFCSEVHILLRTRQSCTRQK